MESLRPVAKGDSDIAVGISGFGSAKVGKSRWKELAILTGRTTYYLQYDAQELPWSTDEDPPPIASVYWDVMDRWQRAREGALNASSYLATWLERWARAGRKILVVGFSLGAFAAWNAVRQVPDDLKPQIQLVMISAAVGDTIPTWDGISSLSSVTNLYSTRDAALLYVYPRGVDTDETPAAGLGPLIVSPLPNLRNVDITDIVGWDHLRASKILPRLTKIALGCMWSSEVIPSAYCEPLEMPLEVVPLSARELSRLLRWTVIDDSLWLSMARAMDGDKRAIHRMRLLDRWSLEDGRLHGLMSAGATVEALLDSPYAPDVALRGRAVLAGLIRNWIETSKDIDL